MVCSPRDQWPPRASPCCASLEMLLCSYLNNKTSLQAHKQKGQTSLETGEQNFSERRAELTFSASWLGQPPTQGKSPFTLLRSAVEDQEHTHTKATKSPLFSAAISIQPLTAEGTRTPQVHGVPHTLLCTHQVHIYAT